MFATTAQEVLGSCIFLFVKHPYDIGDRVDINAEQLTVEHIALLYTVFRRVTNGKTLQIPNIVLNALWVENVTRSQSMREQVSVFCAFDTSFEDINLLKQEMITFVLDSANNRDFHPDLDVDVISIAEMNKLELRVQVRHKSNWSNESLRAQRRSKFMCALVMALRKVPIAGPGGSDASLGSADKPSWSVAVPPTEAIEAYKAYKDKADAKRLRPLNATADTDKGKSTGTDYLSVGVSPETQAVSALNNRRPGVDTIRDDTWNARDDVSTLGRPSTDGRPDLEEVRGLLHKATSAGKRKGGATLSPTFERPSADFGRANIPKPPAGQYAPPPGPPPPAPAPARTNIPGSPISVSTGFVEEYSYQTMAPPPRSSSRPRAPTIENNGERRWEINNPSAPQVSYSTNPYRSQSPPAQGRYPNKRE